MSFVPLFVVLGLLTLIKACALKNNDAEALCTVSRWFMKEFQFVTDSYRLYTLLNRFCDTPNSVFNSGPSQKFILRQVKAMDFSLRDDAGERKFFEERVSFTTKDKHGKSIRAEAMDIGLLMLYGHILYAGASYSYALSMPALLKRTTRLILTIMLQTTSTVLTR